MNNCINILYIGSKFGNSNYRKESLIRLGHKAELIDPDDYIPKNRLIGKWNFETGGLFFENYIHKKLLSDISDKKFDLVIVNGGSLIGLSLVEELRRRFGLVVNYNNDNPFTNRDHRLWRLYLKSVPVYDLIVVCRDVNVSEAYAAGAKRVLRVFMAADEIAHSPRSMTEQDAILWANDVIFVGTWMPERGPFLAELIESGVPLTIYGNRWHKAKEWPVLKRAWKNNAICGDDYAKAIQAAKISIGLLSKGNRDLVTSRTFEIPALGGLLCAERTREHLQLYEEGKEAVFWSNPKECIEICNNLLADEKKSYNIAKQGRLRCLQNGYFNERIMSEIISTAFSAK